MTAIQQDFRSRSETPAAGWRVVHDFWFTLGGAERVSALLAQQVATDGPLITLGGREEAFADAGLGQVEVRYPRLLQEQSYRYVSAALPVLSKLAEPVEGNVVASSYAFSHHVRATGCKVVYCHSPLRQLWSGVDMYTSGMRHSVRTAAELAFAALRQQDRRVAHEAAAYVASSNAVAHRIRKYYGFDAVAVVHPPHDPRFRPGPSPQPDHYLWVGRIVEPYKRLGCVIEAFRKLPDRKLVVVGDGRDAARLRASAPRNVQFLGSLPTEQLVTQYQSARAVIFPSEDDFGLVPVEAMACGTPVLAQGHGGALETVVEDTTGVLFSEPTPDHVIDAVRQFERSSWEPEVIRAHAERRFGAAQFVTRMRQVLEDIAA
jgi:glycosyltransferase involved in cell wall biosynthesis